MKILITGGLGHIGSYLLENINKINKLKKIYVIDNLSTQRFCSLFNLPKTSKKIIFIQKDISLKNALNNFPKVDVFVCIPTTSPLRNYEDINRCIELLIGSDADIVVTATETSRHPSFNMINMETDEEVAKLVMPTKNPVVNRQTVPSRVYDLTTVAYVSRPKYILRAKSIFEGTVRAVVIPPERAVDIDNPLDLAFAEFLLTRNTL